MKKLDNYVAVYEYRTKKNPDAVPVKDVDMDKLPDQATNDGKKISADAAAKVKPGQSAEDNGTSGIWAIDPPTPEEEAEWDTMDPDTQSNNANELASAFQTEENFIVLGEAGWAKTQLITKMAHRAGRHVLTVYLDKAVATDLGGIPIPTKDETSGVEYAKFLMPGWGVKMLEMTKKDPKVKFLLFFDEMNQADPSVLNALMPIVLKHEICGVTFDNIIVGAAGNLIDENGSLTDITTHKPLMSRFPSKIKWEVHTDDTWKEHFEWAHKKWDDKVGAELIDKCAELKDYWKSPRDLTLGVYNFVYKNLGKMRWLKPEKIAERLEGSVVWDNLPEATRNSRKFADDIKKFAQYMYDLLSGKQAPAQSTRRRSKGADQVDSNDKSTIINALSKGFFYNSKDANPQGGDNKKYLCTLENVITELFDPEITGINAEILQKIVKDMEADGKKVKYKTNKDGAADADRNGWVVLG